MIIANVFTATCKTRHQKLKLVKIKLGWIGLDNLDKRFLANCYICIDIIVLPSYVHWFTTLPLFICIIVGNAAILAYINPEIPRDKNKKNFKP